MGKTNIAWATDVWNPVLGCSTLTPGCDNCYAKEIAERFRGGRGYPNGFDVTLKPHKLRDPIKWKDPRSVFVNSMSDVFHRLIPLDYLRQIWDVMLEAHWHTYLILTKRPNIAEHRIKELGLEMPPHIWLGVSVEDQKLADARIPVLLRIPAQNRFLSIEPMLEAVDLAPFFHCVGCPGARYPENVEGRLISTARQPYPEHRSPIDWVITGGESGRNRRQADPDWFRAIRDQCVAAGVPFFFKQGNGAQPGQDRVLDGRTWDQFPDQLQSARFAVAHEGGKQEPAQASMDMGIPERSLH